MVVALVATMLMVQSFSFFCYHRTYSAYNKLGLNADGSASVQSDETLNAVSLVNNFHSNIQYRKSSGVQGSHNANSNRKKLIYSFNLFQVAAMCVEEQLVQVHFMTSQGSLWYWTAEPEESWEDMKYFVSNSKQVNITLEESISTQRKQLYKVTCS